MLISKLCHLILESPNKTPLVKFSLVTQGRIHLFKFTNGNTRAMCEICSQLTIKRPEQHYWHRSGVFNCEQILLIVLMFPLLTLNKYITAGKVSGPAILKKKRKRLHYRRFLRGYFCRSSVSDLFYHNDTQTQTRLN